MNKQFRQRVQRVEQQAQPTQRAFEVWVGTGAADLLGPHGEIISTEEFERRYPDARSIDDPISIGEPVDERRNGAARPIVRNRGE